MSAKDIILRPIDAQTANVLVRRVHYSHKVVNNSQIHIGVFYRGKLEGAMQFGPSLDKRKMIGLVKGTKWNEFIELNRLAFTDVLPRNSESRALAVAMRLLRKHAPHLKWVVTFADGTQCGDGTIYRAAGFVLTSIKRNNQIWQAPTGEIFSRTSLTDNHSLDQRRAGYSIVSRASMTMKGKNGGGKIRDTLAAEGVFVDTGAATMRSFAKAGWLPKEGFQLRYLYFLDPSCKDRLTVPILPYGAIEKAGAGMYRGQSRAGVVQIEEHALQCETALQSDPPAFQPARQGMGAEK